MDARLVSYISVTFMFALTPGATTAVVVRNALAGGRTAGFFTACGAALGNVCQATAAGLGFAVLLSQWPAGFTALRTVGALYLTWLGVRSLWRVFVTPRTPAAAAARATRVQDSKTDFRQGLLTNVLNPSISTFYVAILPTFLTTTGAPGPFVELAAIHISLAFGCHMFWATAFARLRALFARPAFARGLEAVTGLALLALAWKAVR